MILFLANEWLSNDGAKVFFFACCFFAMLMLAFWARRHAEETHETPPPQPEPEPEQGPEPDEAMDEGAEVAREWQDPGSSILTEEEIAEQTYGAALIAVEFSGFDAYEGPADLECFWTDLKGEISIAGGRLAIAYIVTTPSALEKRLREQNSNVIFIPSDTLVVGRYNLDDIQRAVIRAVAVNTLLTKKLEEEQETEEEPQTL